MATTAQTAQGKVYTLLYNNLEDIPTPLAYVHDHHRVANLILDAVSVEHGSMISLEDEKAIYQSAMVENWAVGLNIHVHVAYSGGVYDHANAELLTDEIITLLWENQDLANGYRVYDVSSVDFGIEFDDSRTIGIEIKVIIRKVESYEG